VLGAISGAAALASDGASEALGSETIGRAGSVDGAALGVGALGSSPLRSRVAAEDGSSATGARALCHHAPPRIRTAATSTPITTKVQRGICGCGVASGTCERPGTAER
jgi:hypothetical protein